MNDTKEVMISVNKTMHVCAIRLAYENLPDNSMFRKFIVDMHPCIQDIGWLQSWSDLLPKQFYVDLACGWASGIKRNETGQFVWHSIKDFERCDYHTHNEEVPKCN